MKQVAQNYRTGELTVLDVPRPACKPGGVVVRTLFSLISTGTEMMKVSEAKMSMLATARARPDQVKKVLETVSQQGPVAAYTKVMNRLDSYTPLGYSLAGVVVEVGAGAEELEVGQLVAAAGAEHANHAEYNWVPLNLCVPVPLSVAPRHAAFATVGAIAMHGVRRGEMQLGETAVVVGLGLIGQLAVRILVASGIRVLGIDVVEERCRLAEKAGAVAAAAPTPEGVAMLRRMVDHSPGVSGADCVFIAAGGASNDPVEIAAKLARDRARVVDIGKTRLDLPWNAYYDKELDVRFSRSYGPGRYDPRYELDGVDYPAGHVRWTERRNLACFLDLMGNGLLDVEDLVSHVMPIGDAEDVYRRIGEGDLRGIGLLFDYGEAQPAPRVLTPPAPAAGKPRRLRAGALRVGFVGAGNYATTMLLPHLAKADDVDLVHVATTTALSAANAQRRFPFRTMSTDADALLADDSIDAVFVVTRHHSHAQLVCQALEAGKAVFVEKPLALDTDQLAAVEATVRRTGNDRVMVGFNRRFAPMLVEMRRRLGPVAGPASIRYLVNAGPLERGSWYADAALEGTRFAGEGGHFIDTLSWLLGSSPNGLQAVRTGAGDLHVTLRYPGGSVAQVSYVTSGHPRFPKETIDIAAGGASARLENFREAVEWVGSRRHVQRSFAGQDKGQSALLRSFVDAVRTGADMPIGLPSLLATTRATILAAAAAEECWETL